MESASSDPDEASVCVERLKGDVCSSIEVGGNEDEIFDNAWESESSSKLCVVC